MIFSDILYIPSKMGRRTKQNRCKEFKFGKKPVAMWAQEATVDRYERHGGKSVFKTADGFKTMKGNWTGRMKGYHFLEESEKQGPAIVEREIFPELEKETEKRLRKLGWI